LPVIREFRAKVLGGGTESAYFFRD